MNNKKVKYIISDLLQVIIIAIPVIMSLCVLIYPIYLLIKSIIYGGDWLKYLCLSAMVTWILSSIYYLILNIPED